MILKASKIKKTFYFPSKVEVLKEINLEVRSKESVAIVGKSGEGKSTLLHILGTLEKCCEGELTLCGYSLPSFALNQIRNQHVGFIFQQCHLLEEESVLSNILMPAKIARKPTHPTSDSYKRALSLLEKVSLSHRARFLAKQLSGGERQRVAIARALCNDPDLILADEPSGNLDSLHSQEIHSLLLGLVKEGGKSLIVVTHDMAFARLCDRTLLLRDGALLGYTQTPSKTNF